MAASTPDEHLTWYVINYFGGLMTEPEWLAHRAFIGQLKAEHSDCRELMEKSNTKDPDALALMAEGQQQFMRRARDRILRDHPDKVFLNNCPKCGGLATTPTAQQCRWCFYARHRTLNDHETFSFCGKARKYGRPPPAPRFDTGNRFPYGHRVRPMAPTVLPLTVPVFRRVGFYSHSKWNRDFIPKPDIHSYPDLKMTDQDKPELEPSDPSSEACFDALKARIDEELAVRIAFDDDPSTPEGREALSELIADAVLDVFTLRPRNSPRYRWKQNPR